jgi:NADH dehydrogenase (ubiquinone) Fe-S protein 1
LIDGKSAFFKKLAAAKKPMIVVGSGALEHVDRNNVMAALQKLTKKVPNLMTTEWNGINILQRVCYCPTLFYSRQDASRTAALDIGFVKTPHSTDLKQSKFVYLLAADQIEAKDVPKDAFIVYQGHHGDVGAHYADVILPGCAYTEKSATYVNTEGRSQMTRVAVSAPGDAREDWKIVRALSESVGTTLPYDDVYSLRERLNDYAPHLTQYGVVEQTTFPKLGLEAATLDKVGKASGKPFKRVIDDFYQTDAISRSSATMAKCSASYGNKSGQQVASA